jgi:hypothetical protein
LVVPGSAQLDQFFVHLFTGQTGAVGACEGRRRRSAHDKKNGDNSNVHHFLQLCQEMVSAQNTYLSSIDTFAYLQLFAGMAPQSECSPTMMQVTFGDESTVAATPNRSPPYGWTDSPAWE